VLRPVAVRLNRRTAGTRQAQ